MLLFLCVGIGFHKDDPPFCSSLWLNDSDDDDDDDRLTSINQQCLAIALAYVLTYVKYEFRPLGLG
jgi:hypothetical protein